MTRRRNLLTTALASALVPGTATAGSISVTGMPSHPDTELIAACNEYLRIQRAFEAYYDTLPGDMEDDDPAWAMLESVPALRERIVSLRAVTPEGHVARMRCVAFHYLPHHQSCQDDTDLGAEDRFKAAALRDLVHAERSTVA